MERPTEDPGRDETTPFLGRRGRDDDEVEYDSVSVSAAAKVLPFALLASLAIAVTSATTVAAYASLICRDPAHCQDTESKDYAAAVAVATFLANIAGTFALGPLGQLVTIYQAGVLWVWIICRAASVAMLALGVYLGSIKIALCARLFEGLASDNLLHYNLNAVFTRIPDKSLVSRYMGASLALYMMGMSVGPVIGGLFPNFTTSFAVALIVFLIMAVYLAAISFFLHGEKPKADALYHSVDLVEQFSFTRRISATVRLVLSPLSLLYQVPETRPYCLSVLLYTMVQSFLFPATMVYTSLRFNFTSRENSFLVSLAALTSAIYLVTIHYVVPRMMRFIRLRSPASVPGRKKSYSERYDLVLGAASMSVQLAALTAFNSITQSWHAYLLISISSIGLAASSFMKSHFARTVPNPVQSMGTLTMMETVGAMLSPVVLGAWLAANPGGTFFYLAAGMLGAAMALFIVGGCMSRRGDRLFDN